MPLLRNPIKPASKDKPNAKSLASYAFGEVILVVIGILIAVSINNWNEQRQRSSELSNILNIIKSDLAQDIEESKKVEAYYEKYRFFVEGVLTGEVDEVHYKQHPVTAFVIMGYPELALHRRGLGLLQDYIDSGELSNNLILNRVVTFYNTGTQAVRVDDEIRNTDQSDNLTYWKNTQAWWPEYSFSKKIDGFVKYALNDPDFKNRMASYHLVHYQIFLPEIIKYRSQATELIVALEQ